MYRHNCTQRALQEVTLKEKVLDQHSDAGEQIFAPQMQHFFQWEASEKQNFSKARSAQSSFNVFSRLSMILSVQIIHSFSLSFLIFKHRCFFFFFLLLSLFCGSYTQPDTQQEKILTKRQPWALEEEYNRNRYHKVFAQRIHSICLN